MFRTHRDRGRQRLIKMHEDELKKNAFISLSRRQLELVEESRLLSLNEKIELLLVFIGNKLTTEIFNSIDYRYFPLKKSELANETSIKKLSYLLEQLPFHFFLDKKVIIEKKSGYKRQWKWFQVSVNESVNYFLRNFGDELTEYEEGVLYGFPLSAIRAFGGLIETSNAEKSNAAEYFLAGVGSKDFNKNESEYYNSIWEKLKEVSPMLISKAEKDWADSRRLSNGSNPHTE